MTHPCKHTNKTSLRFYLASSVLLFSGFQLPRSWYNSYAEQLAGSGDYLVLQYETSSGLIKPLLPDEVEVGFIPTLLAWLMEENGNSSSPLFNRVDASRVGLLGHSRGGKLVALALASGISLTPQCTGTSSQHGSPHGSHSMVAEGGRKHLHGSFQEQSLPEPQVAAVLIDPVDSGDGKHKGDAQYPSAVKKLAGKGRSAALIGAGISGWCNPKDEGWRKFWPVLKSGWLQVVNAAGHMQFTDTSGAAGWAWDKFCGGKAATHAEVEEFPVRAALAWFALVFDGKPPTEYMNWSAQQQTLGHASFEVKEADSTA